MSTWVKRSEREPTKADYPIAAGAYLSNQTGGYWDEGHYRIPEALTNWQTHWRSIKADPPPRELTQRERDKNFALKLAFADGSSTVEDVLEAIYAERREVAKLMESGLGPNWGICDNRYKWAEYTTQLRARCDEQGGRK